MGVNAAVLSGPADGDVKPGQISVETGRIWVGDPDPLWIHYGSKTLFRALSLSFFLSFPKGMSLIFRACLVVLIGCNS